jgi:hypothetical protein
VKGKILLLACLVVVLVLSVVASAFAVPMIRTYRGDLVALNGSGVAGTVELVILPPNKVRVKVSAWGLVPDIMHGVHVHGFRNGDPATVPPPDNMYGDGITTLEEAIVYTGPSLLACRPFPRANPSGFIEFTRMYRNEELDGLALTDVSLADRVVMLRGGFLPATYYGAAWDPTLPVAVADLDGPFMQD